MGWTVTWAKLDDRFWMHPKVIASGNVGAGIFARMLSYCGCYLTEGLVPATVVVMIVGEDTEAFERLQQFGLLVAKETGSVLIPDYLEHNPTKAKVKAEIATRRENGAKGGRPPGRSNRGSA